MSKGEYIGVNDKARKVSKMYIGVDGKARKALKGYIGDANGKARQFFSSEKYRWWRRYDVDEWAQQRFYPQSGHSEGDDVYELRLNGDYCFSSYAFNPQTGIYTLSGLTPITWVSYPASTGLFDWFELAPGLLNTYTTGDMFRSTNTGTQMHQITGSGGSNALGTTVYVHCPNAWFRKPVGHSPSGALVKGTSASKPPNGFNVDGGRGYGYKYWNPEYEYDGYYWEYDGYHE